MDEMNEMEFPLRSLRVSDTFFYITNIFSCLTPGHVLTPRALETMENFLLGSGELLSQEEMEALLGLITKLHPEKPKLKPGSLAHLQRLVEEEQTKLEMEISKILETLRHKEDMSKDTSPDSPEHDLG